MSPSRKKPPRRADGRNPELALQTERPGGGFPPTGRSAPAPEGLETEFGPLDERFAELIIRLNGKAEPALRDASRMVSAVRAKGHPCLPLDLLPGPREDSLPARLLDTKVVGRPGEWKPLVLDEANRLYLHRYWSYEQQLAAEIRFRANAPAPALDHSLLASGLDALFEPAPDDQRSAAEKALTGNFTVVTGGPGTGKTRTIARVLALLRAQFAAFGRRPHFALAAPTGKAAARMTDSIRQAVEELRGKGHGDAETEAEAVTLHRLLGVTPDSSTPRFDAQDPLPFDAVIVDEASMIDLALMSKLFAAVARSARIILLGDRDQLASVEAGRVLGDICSGGSGMDSAALGERIAELRRSFRFVPGSGIDRFSRAVNAGDADAAVALLRERPEGIASMDLPRPDAVARSLREKVVDGFRPALVANEPGAALAALDRFRILCAVRRGPYGVEALNSLVQQTLADAGLLAPHGVFHHGRPVMILRNDYTLRLFNGDVGMILRDPEAGNALRAFFQGADGALRRIMPSRLPEHETVWAMTVHKSQGSEFDHVLLVLPDRTTEILGRELLYTAITRSRLGSEIWYREAALREAISRKTQRHSGLHDALWKPGG